MSDMTSPDPGRPGTAAGPPGQAATDRGATIEGVRAVGDRAAALLSRLGSPRRDDLGARFDPARHDAVGTRHDTAAEPGTVVEVVRPAYGDGERQLRPA